MPDKKFFFKTTDSNIVEATIGHLEKDFKTLTVRISKLRIEDNTFEIVLSLTGEQDDICKATSILKKTPSIRLEEI
ncbi:MAG: hypothetical protein SNJ53_00970 [Thermodesulfovibrionales bacterium]